MRPFCRSVWSCVQTEEGEITVKAARHGHLLWVRTDDNSLRNFLNLLLSLKAKQKKSPGRMIFARKEPHNGIAPGALLTAEDDGKIQFNFRKRKWDVRYKKKCKDISPAA